MSTAAAIATALAARRSGAAWMARCPAHEDREPSLAIAEAADGRALLCCHAGCPQSTVIAALRARGLWSGTPSPKAGRRSRTEADRTDSTGRADDRMAKAALAIWAAARPAHGTPAETYLGARGIGLAAPESIRFHAGLRHPTGAVLPGMVALVSDRDGRPLGIHRTFLAGDGRGKAAVEPAKMMLGPCRSGAVRLAEAGELVMVGEGIETCLSVLQATGQPTWAGLSTSGLASLVLPDRVRTVVILADADAPGEAAAQAAARRWTGEGRRVRIARPPHGKDFNDSLRHPLAEGCR